MHGSIVARLLLPHGADAFDDLHVLLEVPVYSEEGEDVASVREVKSVPRRRRVSE